MPAKPAPAADSSRSYEVTGNILHDNILYTPGMTIVFGPEITEEEIRQHIEAGNLDGPKARELRRARVVAEAQTGIAGMDAEEMQRLWASYMRLSDARRKQQEAQQARIKETGADARRANVNDARRAAQVEILDEGGSEE